MSRQRAKPGLAVPLFFAVVTAVLAVICYSLTQTRESGQKVELAEHRPWLQGVVQWLAEHLGSTGVLLIGGALTVLCLLPILLRNRGK